MEERVYDRGTSIALYKKRLAFFYNIVDNVSAPEKGCWHPAAPRGETSGAFFMRLFYLDESGNPELSGPSKCYILAAIGIPISKWTACDKVINQLKTSYNIPDAEVHTAWMLRCYKEQESIPDFDRLSYGERRTAVIARREALIERLKREGRKDSLKQAKKNFKNTDAYIHLTFHERQRFISELAQKIKSWAHARIFAEVIDKASYNPPSPGLTPETQAFERIVTRIEKYLSHISGEDQKEYGLLIHDECESVRALHSSNMKRYYRQGTFGSGIHHIIETPLFVDSSLTGMVQIADLCAYALRRYYDENDDSLFHILKGRADKIGRRIVGINHYVSRNTICTCEICRNKKQS